MNETMLTPQQIADAMAGALYAAGARPFLQQVGECGPNQSHVDIKFPRLAKLGPMEQFTAEYLEPIARELAKSIGGVASAPAIPVGVDESAIGAFRGVFVRYIAMHAMANSNEDGNLFGRFDVTHTGVSDAA